MEEVWSQHWYLDVIIQILTGDSWKCFLMIWHVRPFWHGCAGMVDLSVRPARQILFHVTTAKNGMSAKTLERTFGTKYRVAWTMLQRFRVAMVDAEREPLSGEVEVDESLVGGVQQGGKRGRGITKS